MAESITIEHRGSILEGDLEIPESPKGVVLFAHGSGSSRHSPRNRQVASILRQAGFGTFLMDLLSREEDLRDQAGGVLRFDIGLLVERLILASEQLTKEPKTAGVPLGLFGASTGAGAALVTAARMPERVGAVVSRGGRPDLAAESLAAVTAPTLLIVGGRDSALIEMNREAMDQMKRAEVSLEIVPGATHLFEEPGALEEVARLARGWFQLYLSDG